MKKSQKPVLRFHEDGHFRILMVSDMHGKPDFNSKMQKGFEALIEKTRPDFIMLGGDQLCNITPKLLKTFLETVMKPAHDRNIPWAHVFGNHDPEEVMTKEESERVYERFPLCLSSRGPKSISGIPNYCIPVLAHGSDDPRYHIWGMDSFSSPADYLAQWGRKEPFQNYYLRHGFGSGHPNCSTMFNQNIWYYQESLRREKKAGHKIPGLMFMHVPPVEFMLVGENPEQMNMVGNKRESPATSELNSGIFLACLERGDVRGIFCGHDHLNDFQAEYLGITLAYDGAIGYDMSAHDDMRGGRIIDIYENGEMFTRMIHLIDLLGKDAMRDPDYFEGGCKYFIRKFD